MSGDKPTLLLVDDEERILRSLAMLFRATHQVLSTVDAHQALDWVARQRVHVIVSDQRMPLMRGADLLRQVKERSPNTMRLLLTGYSELDAIVASVNEGEVFRFINKPWDAAELRQTVGQATEIALNLFSAHPTVAAPVTLLTETGQFVAPSQREGLLVIDEDADVIRTVQEIVGPAQPVYWAQTLDQALQHLEQHEIGVIVSELLVGGEPVTRLLKLLKAEHPQVVTIVMTPFQDTQVLVGLINQGQVFRFLPKPVRRGPLGMNLASALRQHRSLKASPVLRLTQQVQKAPEPVVEEAGVAGRVLGFLSRLRSRGGLA
ncbi:MAG TPA: response regulator [Nevskiaceae bacterium]|nr:response regulator [Nevskiaceae bacterium]